MEPMSTIIGFIVIVVFYSIFGVTIGLGSIYLSKLFSDLRMEQVFFGVLFVLIAAFYLAFTMYFGNTEAWSSEMIAVILFAALGLIGIRYTPVLIIVYVLHGFWDGIHEFNMHFNEEAWNLTSLPLAYGFLCIAYDFFIAGYFYTRRKEWRAAWTGITTTSS
jgi:hypothetical protein